MKINSAFRSVLLGAALGWLLLVVPLVASAGGVDPLVPGQIAQALARYFGAPIAVSGTPTDGYLLTYSSSSGTWVASAAASGNVVDTLAATTAAGATTADTITVGGMNVKGATPTIVAKNASNVVLGSWVVDAVGVHHFNDTNGDPGEVDLGTLIASTTIDGSTYLQLRDGGHDVSLFMNAGVVTVSPALATTTLSATGNTTLGDATSDHCTITGDLALASASVGSLGQVPTSAGAGAACVWSGVSVGQKGVGDGQTATVTNSITLDSSYQGKIIIFTGTVASTITLPTASAGAIFTVVYEPSSGTPKLKIAGSAAGQFVSFLGTRTATGGYVQTTTADSTITVVGASTTVWVAQAWDGAFGRDN